MDSVRPQNHDDPSRAPFVALEGSAEGATVFTCALCGTRFTHGRQVCGACPLNRGCSLVSCPHCGYGFPRSSRLIDWMRRLWSRAKREWT